LLAIPDFSNYLPGLTSDNSSLCSSSPPARSMKLASATFFVQAWKHRRGVSPATAWRDIEDLVKKGLQVLTFWRIKAVHAPNDPLIGALILI
jgi:putative SOS response-associated peptidase YedK